MTLLSPPARTPLAVLAPVVMALATLTFAPTAAQASANKQVQRACLSDYKRLCPAYRINTPQMRACMEAKALDLSSGCVNALIDAGEVDRRYKR